MVNLCRVCLNFLTEGSECFSLNTVVLNSGYVDYGDKLSACIPEITLEAVCDPVICVPCAASLESAYEFRNKCLETEVRIQTYMQEKTRGLSTIKFDDTFLQYLGFNFVIEDNDGEVTNEIKIEEESISDEIDPTDEITLGHESVEGDMILEEEPTEEIYEEEIDYDLEETIQLIECMSCSKKFTSLMHFNVHQLTDHGNNSNQHTCVFCKRPFNSNMSLERHMKNAHKEYTCKFCGEEFDNKIKYNKHLRTLHGVAHNGFPVKSPKSTGSPTVKNKRENLPKQAKRIMYKWLLENCQHPYPTDSQKKELVEQTNLTLLQVTNWFINARRRILQPLLEKCGGLIDVEAEIPDD